MAKAKNNYYCWVVGYIDSALLEKLENQLDKNQEYAEIEAYIPTVRILKKTDKKGQHFEEVPLLFNYGFFKIPRKFAIHREFLEQMQKNISCIYAWVRDPLKLVKGKPILRPDGGHIDYSQFDDTYIDVATASSADISRMIREALTYSAYSSEHLDSLQLGDEITLRGYPWEGIRATIKTIDPIKETVKVEVNIMERMTAVNLSFDSVFFTIYHDRGNYDDSISIVKSLDEMSDNNTLDRFIAKHIKPE